MNDERSTPHPPVSDEPLHVVLDGICRLLDGITPGTRSTVVLAEGRDVRVRFGAGSTLAEAFPDAVNGRSVAPPYWAPCAKAIDQQVEVQVDDIGSDGYWSGGEWANLIQAAGIRSCWAMPMQASDGRVLGSLAVYHDHPAGPPPEQRGVIRQIKSLAGIVIERSQAVLALKRTEAQLARAQRISATGSFNYIAATNELTVSGETCRICGFDPTRPVSPEAMRDRIHPADRQLFFRMITGSAQRYEFDCRVRLDDGEVRYVRTIGDAIRDEEGRLLEWVGVIRDKTGERAVQQALQDMRSALARVSRITTIGALTASLTHEINQPLTGVVTNSGMLQRMFQAEPIDANEVRETVQRLRRDAIRAAQVMQDLREWFANKKFTVHAVDLNQALRDVLTLLADDLQRARAHLVLELGPDLPAVAAERVQLQHVVVNLVLNAMDAMADRSEDQRSLSIRTEVVSSGFVRVQIRDTGPGFRAGDSQRLFDTFYTTKPGGMGLGLSISRTIIENHQGRIWVDTQSGPGGCVMFTLPCWRESSA